MARPAQKPIAVVINPSSAWDALMTLAQLGIAAAVAFSPTFGQISITTLTGRHYTSLMDCINIELNRR